MSSNLPEISAVEHRPERPDDCDFTAYHPSNFNLYLVCTADRAVAYYDATYYPDASYVVDDMIERIGQGHGIIDFGEPGFETEGGIDFTVWRHNRLMAAVHYHYDDPTHERRVEIFNEVTNGHNNDKGREWVRDGWPSRSEWIAAGGGKIVRLPIYLGRNPGRQ